MSAATAGSTPSGRGIAAASGTTEAPAIVPIPQYDRTGSPSPVASTVAPSGILCRNDGESGHAHGRPARHDRQTPHGTSQDKATGWPTRTLVTPGPTASTTPAPSWPMTIGVGRGHSPSRTCRSEWQTPDARSGRGPRRRAVRRRPRPRPRSAGRWCAGRPRASGGLSRAARRLDARPGAPARTRRTPATTSRRRRAPRRRCRVGPGPAPSRWPRARRRSRSRA